MKLRALLTIALVGAGVGPVMAETPAQQPYGSVLLHVQEAASLEATQRVLQLSKTMQIEGVLSVMREEGFDYGKSMEAEMFPGRGGVSWKAAVEQIYDEAAMKSVFETALTTELQDVEPAALAVMETFFGSERGQRILTLEIQARRALLDPDTEEAARAHVEDLIANKDPSLALIREFAEVNGLIEMNVAGTLNANLAFFKGMASSGGIKGEMSEDEMLKNVWSQEASIREETESWLFPYLALAYEPLSRQDMQAYLAFSNLPEGKALNAAVFAAFDTLFTDISTNLGRAAAKRMHGEDI